DPDRFFQLLARLFERRDLAQCDTELQAHVRVARILFCQLLVLSGCRRIASGTEQRKRQIPAHRNPTWLLAQQTFEHVSSTLKLTAIQKFDSMRVTRLR